MLAEGPPLRTVGTMQAVAWRVARPFVRPAAVARCPLRLSSRVIGTAGVIARHAARPLPGGAIRCVPSAARDEHSLGEVAEALSQGEHETTRQRPGKRKVALFCGYEGTGYKGLQMNRETAPDQTIEDALEQAIYRAGGILESNLGALNKLRWGRSSRTDKSVHSLATVISLKMECDPEAFEEDPEGLGIAERINSHLPPEMRVFSVQRVSKSFSARSECNRRTYHYYLPASVLGLRLDGGPQDAKRLELLAQCWAAFEGHHPFHNYTKRRLYRNDGSGDGRVGGHRDHPRQRGGRRQDGELAAALDEEEEGSEGDASSEWGTDVDNGAGASTAPSLSPSGSDTAAGAGEAGSSGYEAGPNSTDAGSFTTSSRSSSAAGAADGASEAGGWQPGQGNKVEVQWKGERDMRDPVVRRHYRYMDWCRVGPGPVALAPGGPPCIQLTLCGNSFMLHQIRKMVAASVAVARGIIPLELVRASLAAPARVVLPLAPPMTLVLAGAQFAPFRKSWDNRTGTAALLTGDRLDLRPGGAAAQREFWEQTLQPAISELLGAEEWAQWERDLELMWFDEGEVAALVAAHEEWQQAYSQRREARAEEE